MLIITGALLAACGQSGEAAAPSSALVPQSAERGAGSSSQKGFTHFKPATKPVISEESDVRLSELKIPILVYHHIRKQEGWSKATWSWKMTVTPETFEKQMRWISEHGYTSITLDAFYDIMTGAAVAPPKPIVITFDDNNVSQYDVALPILEKYKLTGVFYLVTNRLKLKGVVDAERAKDMSARGMDIQSHTLDHATMTNLSLKRLDEELVQSKKALEDITGKPVRHLAYPSTAQNKTVREHAKLAGYATATIMDPRPATVKDDLLKLPRIMMTDDTNLQKVLP